MRLRRWVHPIRLHPMPAGAFVDWTMPEMTGSETLTALRDLAPDLPVIQTSGHAPDDIAGRYVGDGHLAFLAKPYDLDALQRAFRAVPG